MTKTEKRYIVEQHPQGGAWYQTYGWRCVDTRPVAPEFRVVASGTKAHMTRWARELNRRES